MTGKAGVTFLRKGYKRLQKGYILMLLDICVLQNHVTL